MVALLRSLALALVPAIILGGLGQVFGWIVPARNFVESAPFIGAFITSLPDNVSRFLFEDFPGLTIGAFSLPFFLGLAFTPLTQAIFNALFPLKPLFLVPMRQLQEPPVLLLPKGKRLSFQGRQGELTALDQFVAAKDRVLWWSIHGPGGVGKTRLATEWLSRAADGRDRKDAGFWKPGAQSMEFVQNWRPRRDTLIVIDEAMGLGEEPWRLIESLARRQDKFRHKVRVLLIDWSPISAIPAETQMSTEQQNAERCMMCYYHEIRLEKLTTLALPEGADRAKRKAGGKPIAPNLPQTQVQFGNPAQAPPGMSRGYTVVEVWHPIAPLEVRPLNDSELLARIVEEALPASVARGEISRIVDESEGNPLLAAAIALDPSRSATTAIRSLAERILARAKKAGAPYRKMIALAALSGPIEASLAAEIAPGASDIDVQRQFFGASRTSLKRTLPALTPERVAHEVVLQYCVSQTDPELKAFATKSLDGSPNRYMRSVRNMWSRRAEVNRAVLVASGIDSAQAGLHRDATAEETAHAMNLLADAAGKFWTEKGERDGLVPSRLPVELFEFRAAAAVRHMFDVPWSDDRAPTALKDFVLSVLPADGRGTYWYDWILSPLDVPGADSAHAARALATAVAFVQKSLLSDRPRMSLSDLLDDATFARTLSAVEARDSLAGVSVGLEIMHALFLESGEDGIEWVRSRKDQVDPLAMRVEQVAGVLLSPDPSGAVPDDMWERRAFVGAWMFRWLITLQEKWRRLGLTQAETGSPGSVIDAAFDAFKIARSVQAQARIASTIAMALQKTRYPAQWAFQWATWYDVKKDAPFNAASLSDHYALDPAQKARFETAFASRLESKEPRVAALLGHAASQMMVDDPALSETLNAYIADSTTDFDGRLCAIERLFLLARSEGTRDRALDILRELVARTQLDEVLRFVAALALIAASGTRDEAAEQFIGEVKPRLRNAYDKLMSFFGNWIHKLKAKDTTGRWAYYFVFVTPDKETAFLGSIGGSGIIDLEDYGKVIASCYGEEPTQEIKDFLKEKYDFLV